MANMLLKAYGAYVQELRDALDLECSRKNAKAYGTLKEWKSIDEKSEKQSAILQNFGRAMTGPQKQKRISRIRARSYLFLFFCFY